MNEEVETIDVEGGTNRFTDGARSMMYTTYSDVKYDKSKELNSSMTINPASQDEYERTIESLRG